MYKLITFLVICGTLLSIDATAQRGDTISKTFTVPPITTSPEFHGIVIQSPITGQTQVLMLPEMGIKQKKFYKDLEWPPKQKVFDPLKPNLYLGIKKQPSILEVMQENPIYAVYTAVAIVAGMLNHRIEGINKEIELNTKINTYTRTNVPVSARDPFIVPE